MCSGITRRGTTFLGGILKHTRVGTASKTPLITSDSIVGKTLEVVTWLMWETKLSLVFDFGFFFCHSSPKGHGDKGFNQSRRGVPETVRAWCPSGESTLTTKLNISGRSGGCLPINLYNKPLIKWLNGESRTVLGRETRSHRFKALIRSRDTH